MTEMPAEMSADEFKAWQLSQYREDQWQTYVEREAEQRGWLVFHDRDSRRNNPGFPDCCLAHPTFGTCFLELKEMRGRVRAEQKVWLATLQASGQKAYLCRPSNVEDVERLLDGEDVWIGPRFGLDWC